MPLLIDCPACGEPLEVDDEHRTWQVRCPHCRHEFRPADAHRAADDRPPPRRPRRRRDDRDPEAAARDVATPALLLELTGWGSGVLVLAVAGLLVLLGVAAGNQPQQPPGKEPPEFFVFVGTCLGVLALPYCGAIVYGARRLRNLSGYGWAMAAAVLATASIVLLGVCGVLLMGPGIWALVVINREHVRAAFDARTGRRPRDEYED